jgi:hypothetical protein
VVSVNQGTIKVVHIVGATATKWYTATAPNVEKGMEQFLKNIRKDYLNGLEVEAVQINALRPSQTLRP